MRFLAELKCVWWLNEDVFVDIDFTFYVLRVQRCVYKMMHDMSLMVQEFKECLR